MHMLAYVFSLYMYTYIISVFFPLVAQMIDGINQIAYNPCILALRVGGTRGTTKLCLAFRLEDILDFSHRDLTPLEVKVDGIA
jgi:hypothetical protein